MKALIISTQLKKEVETKNGVMFQHSVTYALENGESRTAGYLSKVKDQTTFRPNEESEFTESSREWNGQTYYDIKPITQNKFSPGGRAVKKEQSRYSGFSLSYAKDLVIAGKVELKDLFNLSEKMFDHMVSLDKKLEG